MTDSELISKLGGVSVLSGYLGVSYQCVFNWLKRGIPSQVKLDHKDIFLCDNPCPELIQSSKVLIRSGTSEY